MDQNIPWDLRRRGLKDSIRHDKRIKDAIKKNLKDLIGEENIIASDGKKKVKIPIKYLDQYKFRYSLGSNRDGVGHGKGKVGDKIAEDRSGQQPGQDGQPGNQPGEEIYEAEIEMEELIQYMLEDLALPWLEEKQENQIASESIDFSDVRKKGQMSNIDKRRSLLENLKRNAQKNVKRIKDLKEDDLRFRTWEQIQKFHSNAVVFLLMDRSGSMTTGKKYIVKSFFFWMVQFLKKKYSQVQMVFIAHDTEAAVVPEKDFFLISNSGGTRCSSAYSLALEEINAKYPKKKWNSYVFHFSDGDNWDDDNELCTSLIEKLSKRCNMVGYGEVSYKDEGSFYGWGGVHNPSWSTLNDRLKKLDAPNFVTVTIKEKSDVYKALEKFLNKELGEKDG
ncbi:YeaH/YhbH family protein [Candidatus Riflebacteria bacterium]